MYQGADPRGVASLLPGEYDGGVANPRRLKVNQEATKNLDDYVHLQVNASEVACKQRMRDATHDGWDLGNSTVAGAKPVTCPACLAASGRQ